MFLFFIFLTGILSMQISDAISNESDNSSDDSSDSSSEELELVPASLSKGMPEPCQMFSGCVQFIRRLKDSPAIVRNFTSTLTDFELGISDAVRQAVRGCTDKSLLEAIICFHDGMIRIREIADSVSDRIQPALEYTSAMKQEFEKCLDIEPHF